VSSEQEVMLKQKVRTKWLETGDLYTRYFHTKLKWRRMKNTIKVIYIDN